MSTRKLHSFLPAQEDSEISLPITPMADILIVLLIFLLKGISMNAHAFAGIQPDIQLPQASGHDSQVNAVRVSIGPKYIVAGEKILTDWSNFVSVAPSAGNDQPLQLDSNGLRTELLKSGFAEVIRTSGLHVEIHADRDVPYSIVRALLALASETGASDIQLGVAEK